MTEKVALLLVFQWFMALFVSLCATVCRCVSRCVVGACLRGVGAEKRFRRWSFLRNSLSNWSNLFDIYGNSRTFTF